SGSFSSKLTTDGLGSIDANQADDAALVRVERNETPGQPFRTAFSTCLRGRSRIRDSASKTRVNALEAQSRLQPKSQALRLQIRHDLFEHTVRRRTQFLVGAVLDRVLHELHRRIVPERLTLRGSSHFEFRGRNPDRDDTELFEPPDVMHTARCAGASV